MLHKHHIKAEVFIRVGRILETAFLNENRRKKIEDKNRFPQFLLCMYVCVCICVCLSVAIVQTSSFNIRGWNFNIDTYMWISQNGIFYFFFIFFDFFRNYSSLVIFYYFLYFKDASKSIMKSNIPKWSFGLVEYIMYNDIYFASLWHHHMTW